MARARDFPAMFSAAPANRDAILHLAEFFAVFATRLTDPDAQRGHLRVKLAFMREQLCCRGADRGAVEQQADVLRAGVFAAQFQTMHERHGMTGEGTMGEGRKRLMRFAVELMHDSSFGGFGGYAGG
ncbi:hypothetical protein GCM10008941_20890 [Rhizomicrobium palustre]